jgi:hypothetical protein
MVTVAIGGGVGNQMFQYAAGRALSLRQGSALRLDPLELLDPMGRPGAAKRHYILDKYFAGDFPLIGLAKPFQAVPIPYVPAVLGKMYGPVFAKLGRFKLVRDPKTYGFEPSVIDLKGNVYLHGGWISERYFKDYAPAVRKDFAFKRRLVGAAAEMAQRIGSAKAVALHVRRGDRVWGAIPSSLHVVVSQEYYDRALDYITKKAGKDITIFIFSDEVEWCRANLKFSYPHVFMAEGHTPFADDEDMHLMSLCQHFILPNSTFSWWGAWLSENPGKIVVAPKEMFHNNSFSDLDAFPPEWVRV